MSICYKCTYECDLVNDAADARPTIQYGVIQEGPCGKSFTPPSATGGTGCRLVKSEQVECTTTGDKTLHTVVGAAGGVVVVFLLVSNPAGWVIGGCALVGGIVGWLSS